MESGGFDTTTIRHLIPSCRHQLSSIAPSDSTASNDVIDLADVPFSNTGYWLFQAATSSSSNILTIVENGLVGSNAYTLNLDSSAPFTGAFSLSEDARGGTEIVASSNAVPGSPLAFTGYSDTPSGQGAAIQNPYGSVVQIHVTYSSGQGNGTGFVVDKHFILTAAHVLDPPSSATGNTLVTPESVLISYVGTDGLPAELTSTTFAACSAWDPTNNFGTPSSLDFAVIYVSQDLSQLGLSEFDLGVATPGVTSTFNATGYPNGDASTQYTLIGQATPTSDGTLNTSTLNTVVGESGGPIWIYDGQPGTDGQPEAIGLVSQAGGDLAFFNSYIDSSGIPIKGNLDQIADLEHALCFMPGSMIRTPSGETAVELLQSGDVVITVGGKAKRVSWIGRQTVSTRFADPLRVLPIRIRANALGDNMPSRDLLLSPDHAILVDGILVQAGALVNGTSIVRETDVPETFAYYHVELDDHSLILAENTPAETFIDNVDRLAFDNWAEYEALYPEGKPIVEMPYPRAKAYRQVPQAIRERLAHRRELLFGMKMSAVA